MFYLFTPFSNFVKVFSWKLIQLIGRKFTFDFIEWRKSNGRKSKKAKPSDGVEFMSSGELRQIFHQFSYQLYFTTQLIFANSLLSTLHQDDSSNSDEDGGSDNGKQDGGSDDEENEMFSDNKTSEGESESEERDDDYNPFAKHSSDEDSENDEGNNGRTFLKLTEWILSLLFSDMKLIFKFVLETC